ncbi:MAG: hypothetical protein Q8N55_03280 [bacterium]|nr:hypothetical protein [bacterium]
MKKILNKFLARKLKERGETGPVQNQGRLDKLYAITRRKFGLAQCLEHVRNRGKQNEK